MKTYTQFYTRDFMSGKPIKVRETLALNELDKTATQIRHSRSHMEKNSFIGFRIYIRAIIFYSEGETS